MDKNDKMIGGLHKTQAIVEIILIIVGLIPFTFIYIDTENGFLSSLPLIPAIIYLFYCGKINNDEEMEKLAALAREREARMKENQIRDDKAKVSASKRKYEKEAKVDLKKQINNKDRGPYFISSKDSKKLLDYGIDTKTRKMIKGLDGKAIFKFYSMGTDGLAAVDDVRSGIIHIFNPLNVPELVFKNNFDDLFDDTALAKTMGSYVGGGSLGGLIGTAAFMNPKCDAKIYEYSLKFYNSKGLIIDEICLIKNASAPNINMLEAKYNEAAKVVDFYITWGKEQEMVAELLLNN